MEIEHFRFQGVGVCPSHNEAIPEQTIANTEWRWTLTNDTNLITEIICIQRHLDIGLSDKLISTTKQFSEILVIARNRHVLLNSKYLCVIHTSCNNAEEMIERMIVNRNHWIISIIQQITYSEYIIIPSLELVNVPSNPVCS